MAGVAVLQLATEYLGTRDPSRLVSKSIALLIGLPLLIVWAFALFRWASRKRFGALAPLFTGAVTAGFFFAGLLWVTRAATFSLTSLRPHHEPFGEGDTLRVGFALGLTYYALWALAFVPPGVRDLERPVDLAARTV